MQHLKANLHSSPCVFLSISLSLSHVVVPAFAIQPPAHIHTSCIFRTPLPAPCFSSLAIGYSHPPLLTSLLVFCYFLSFHPFYILIIIVSILFSFSLGLSRPFGWLAWDILLHFANLFVHLLDYLIANLKLISILAIYYYGISHQILLIMFLYLNWLFTKDRVVHLWQHVLYLRSNIRGTQHLGVSLFFYHEF